jgi:hypothetical protein
MLTSASMYDSTCPICREPLITVNGNAVGQVRRRVDDAYADHLTEQLLAGLNSDVSGDQSPPPTPPRNPLTPPRPPHGRRRRSSDDDTNTRPTQRRHLDSRCAQTLSWLYIPLIHAALDRNEGNHIVPDDMAQEASAFMPPQVWDNTVTLLARDFRSRGLTRLTHHLANHGYLYAHDQEAVLDGVESVAISTVLDLVPQRRDAMHGAAATRASVQAALNSNIAADHLLLPVAMFNPMYDF